MIGKAIYSSWLVFTIWDYLSLRHGHPDPLGFPFWVVCAANVLCAIYVIFLIFTSGQERRS